MRKWMLLLVSGVVACNTAGAADGAGESAPGDSIHAMSVMIERFQARHERPAGLGDDAPRSMDELIARFTQAVQDSSAAALTSLTIGPAEFAWIYFPTSMFAAPPYEQPPEITWLLTEQNSLKGQSRLLRHLGGNALDVVGWRCEDEPRVEGSNRTWSQCALALRQQDGSVRQGVRLFGSVLERDGRFRFISLANRL